MSSKLLTRIAPTPSGWLHLGNIANFLLIEKAAKHFDANIILRIDDCDGSRTRKEYIEHIFLVLKFLEIEYQFGPKNLHEFETDFSQNNRKEFYFNELQKISDKIYACECSRKDIGDSPYPGTCRNKKIIFEPLKHSLRFTAEDDKIGDFVVWRKDDWPSYQLCSVVDDLRYGVNLIIRGEDLFESTLMQQKLAKAFTKLGFSEVRFYHHPLILKRDGEKLSKTKHSESILDLIHKGISAQKIRTDLNKLVDKWFQTIVS